jgi:aminoglycoside phosphotransferase family enzyme
VPFHGGAVPAKNAGFDYPSNVQKWEENLADLQPFLGTLIQEDVLAAVQKFGAEFIDAHHDLFARRMDEGWIRDVHGDLHCEHVCFAPEGIQIFDCIEFSPQLRCCDLASEIGFLLMDLEVRRGTLVAPFLTVISSCCKIPTYGCCPFYQYCALVRGKVSAVRLAPTTKRRDTFAMPCGSLGRP